jgi:hypothetical protein
VTPPPYTTSSPPTTPFAGSGGMTWKGAWAPGAYAAGDVVTNAGKLYVAEDDVLAGGAPSHIGSSAAAVASGTATPLSLPAGAAAGDLSVLLYAMQSGQGAVVLPTGYTQVGTPKLSTTSGYIQINVATKTLTGPDVAAGLVTVPANLVTVAALTQVFRTASGVDAARLLATTTLTSPAVTPPAATLVVYAGAAFGYGAVTDTPVGSGERVANDGGARRMLCGYDAASTASPQHTFTFATPDNVGEQVCVAFPLTAGGFPSASFTQIATI